LWAFLIDYFYNNKAADFYSVFGAVLICCGCLYAVLSRPEEGGVSRLTIENDEERKRLSQL